VGKRDRVEAHAASIVADYAMFVTLDASLRFTRVEGRRPQAPTPQRRDLTLVSGGVRDRRSPDDRARAASGGMPWKIASHRDPFGHYVGLDAGIRYVTAARETSSDPVIRGNADRTLRTLTRLAAGRSRRYEVRFHACALAATRRTELWSHPCTVAHRRSDTLDQ